MTTNDTKRHELIDILQQDRTARSPDWPVKKEAAEFLNALLNLLFPDFYRDRYIVSNDIAEQIDRCEGNLTALITPLVNEGSPPAAALAAQFFDRLPGIRRALWLDAEAINAGDPAAHSVEEVLLAYPGFVAVAAYRFAHALHELEVPILPRLITEVAHERTAVDIHPGARIGHSFVIDHGTGIVIGESAEIGEHVKIYQGVTLGALSVEKHMARSKRHPTIGDHVVVYAHAVILGGETVVGHHSVIGGNVWLTESVPPHSVVHYERSVIVQDRNAVSSVIDWVI